MVRSEEVYLEFLDAYLDEGSLAATCKRIHVSMSTIWRALSQAKETFSWAGGEPATFAENFATAKKVFRHKCGMMDGEPSAAAGHGLLQRGPSGPRSSDRILEDQGVKPTPIPSQAERAATRAALPAHLRIETDEEARLAAELLDDPTADAPREIPVADVRGTARGPISAEPREMEPVRDQACPDADPLADRPGDSDMIADLKRRAREGARNPRPSGRVAIGGAVGHNPRDPVERTASGAPAAAADTFRERQDHYGPGRVPSGGYKTR